MSLVALPLNPLCIGESVILIAEDETTIRFLATEFLTDAGFTVIEAEHSAEALAILLLHKIDLVFTDINMPGDMKGDYLADWLLINHPGMPVLLTSGDVRPKIATLYRRFISKPYQLSEVEQHIRQLLN